MRGIAWAAGVVAVAACGGSDVTAPPTDIHNLTCVNPTAAGAAVTCSVTLPAAAASVKAVLADHQTCEAHGDAFVSTAPVAATLTVDGCFDPVGTEMNLTGPYNAETTVTFEFTPGLLDSGSPGVAAAQVTGQYPEWTIHMEDAKGAFAGEVDDYDDVTVTVTVQPAS